MTRRVQKIAQNLKRARTAAGMSQQRLAELAGVSIRTVSRLELGETRHPREDEFQRIAAALGTTADDLMGIEEHEADALDDEGMSLREAQRRIAQEVGDEDVVFGFVRLARNRDKVDPGDWSIIQLAIKAANKRLSEGESKQPE